MSGMSSHKACDEMLWVFHCLCVLMGAGLLVSYGCIIWLLVTRNCCLCVKSSGSGSINPATNHGSSANIHLGSADQLDGGTQGYTESGLQDRDRDSIVFENKLNYPTRDSRSDIINTPDSLDEDTPSSTESVLQGAVGGAPRGSMEVHLAGSSFSLVDTDYFSDGSETLDSGLNVDIIGSKPELIVDKIRDARHRIEQQTGVSFLHLIVYRRYIDLHVRPYHPDTRATLRERLAEVTGLGTRHIRIRADPPPSGSSSDLDSMTVELRLNPSLYKSSTIYDNS